jgi:hypothetical protein
VPIARSHPSPAAVAAALKQEEADTQRHEALRAELADLDREELRARLEAMSADDVNANWPVVSEALGRLDGGQS